jgi:hypothetical protein
MSVPTSRTQKLLADNCTEVLFACSGLGIIFHLQLAADIPLNRD